MVLALDLRLMGEPEVSQMVLQLAFEAFGVLIGLRIGWHHFKVATVGDIKAAIGHNLNQVVKVVCKRLTVLNHKAPILTICEIIFGQICTCD